MALASAGVSGSSGSSWGGVGQARSASSAGDGAALRTARTPGGSDAGSQRIPGP
jgi:hypothetical protein